jgi:phosphoserine phosphatase
MKIVLRHKTTGRYYREPGKWVRRADNALAFDAVEAARQYLSSHGIEETQAVLRLAPYLMPLLQVPQAKTWESWLHSSSGQWYADRVNRFGRN